MSSEQAPSFPEKSLEHLSLTPHTRTELERAIDLAFDYRGDVTLGLKSGESVLGYVFAYRTDQPDPFVELYLKGQADRCLVRFRDIETVTFSGEDTAAGKSWEAWLKKKHKEG